MVVLVLVLVLVGMACFLALALSVELSAPSFVVVILRAKRRTAAAAAVPLLLSVPASETPCHGVALHDCGSNMKKKIMEKRLNCNFIHFTLIINLFLLLLVFQIVSF